MAGSEGLGLFHCSSPIGARDRATDADVGGRRDRQRLRAISSSAVLFNSSTSPTWSRASINKMLARVRRPFSRGASPKKSGLDFNPRLVERCEKHCQSLRRIGGALQQLARFHNSNSPRP